VKGSRSCRHRIPRFTPMNATTRAALGPAFCTARRRLPATTWWPRWMPSTARCWSRRSACIATTPVTPKRSTRRIRAGSGLVKPVDTTDPAVADTIADWASTKGTVGIRIMLRDEVSADPADPGINRALAAAARHSLPVNLMCWGRLGQAAQLGGPKPQHAAGDRPSRPATTARAASARRAVRRSAKAAGPGGPRQHRGENQRRLHLVARTLPLQRPMGSARPYLRCLQLRSLSVGTDWTRAVGLLTYRQGVESFRVTDRLSDSDRAVLMGETLQRVYNWSPAQA
jgi:L-fuconolactonase